jgi:hypothetical protein
MITYYLTESPPGIVQLIVHDVGKYSIQSIRSITVRRVGIVQDHRVFRYSRVVLSVDY